MFDIHSNLIVYLEQSEIGIPTSKGILTGDYHFRTVYIWDEENRRMLRRLLVIRRTINKKGDYEYKYQTRKWLVWHHQMALNFILSTFLLKEKLISFDDLPLLSARDIKRWIVFKLYRQMSDDDMIDQMFERHCRRQRDINVAFEKQILMC